MSPKGIIIHSLHIYPSRSAFKNNKHSSTTHERDDNNCLHTILMNLPNAVRLTIIAKCSHKGKVLCTRCVREWQHCISFLLL